MPRDLGKPAMWEMETAGLHIRQKVGHLHKAGPQKPHP